MAHRMSDGPAGTLKPRRVVDRSAALIALFSGAVLIGAELTVLAGGLAAGALAHAVALVVLLLIGVARRDRPDGRLAIALAVVPVLRLASIAVPAVIVPRYAWYFLIGAPVLVAIALAARALALRSGDLGLRLVPLRDLSAMALAGLGLGLAGYVIGEPDPLPAGSSPIDVGLTSLGLILTGALLEEILFRGLVQRVAAELVHDRAILVSAALTGLLYLGSLNPRFVVFAIVTAGVFGIEARRTGSLAAPMVGHATLVWTMFVLWPGMLG